jgi:hypothetical protein
VYVNCLHEQDGQHGEANQLQRLAADSINGSNGEPITGDSTGADQDTVTGSKVVELVVDGVAASVADSLEDSRRIQTKTVECNLDMY